MDNTITAVIKGKVIDVFSDSYKNKAGEDVHTTKCKVVTDVNGEPFKSTVEVPKGLNLKKGDTLEHPYQIFATKTGYVIARPL